MEIFQNIYYSQTKKKKESTDVRHLVYTRNGLSLGLWGALRENMLTLDMVSCIPPPSQSDCRKFICSIISIINFMIV